MVEALASERLKEIANSPASPEAERRFREYFTIKGFFSVAEGRFLYNYILKSPVQGVIVEIGSMRGLSTMYLADAAKQRGEKVYAVDPHPEKYDVDFNYGKSICEEFKANVAKHGFTDTIIHLEISSEEALRSWSLPVKLLFIDGEHTYDAVKVDVGWLNHVAPGGLASFHDAGTPGVLQAMREFVHNRSNLAEFSSSPNSYYVKKPYEWWNP